MSDDIVYRYYVIAYIDILGQKEAFQNADHVPLNNEEAKDRLIEVLKKTYGFVKSFRAGFKNYFDQVNQQAIVKNNLDNKEILLNQMQACDIQFSQFSDSVIAFIPIEKDSNLCKTINGIWGILTASASMFILSLSAKHAIRGGIEIGAGLEIDTGEPYGPALNKAYSLESQVADYPRIVIGGELIRFLHSRAAMNEKDLLSQFAKEYANKCLSIIKRDRDGFYFLDWLGEGIEDLFKTIPRPDQTESTEKTLQDARQFIHEEREKFILKQNIKLVERYTKLCNYFNSCVINWKAWKK